VRVDAVLEVGAANESVSVQAEAPLLKTESGEISYNVTSNTLDELPILTLAGSPNTQSNPSGLGNIRNPLAAVELLHGTRFSTDYIMRINGMPSSSQSINLEGQDATNGFYQSRTQINQAGVEAIQEVAIQTSNFSAEYGKAGAGYFNYTMKSGTNQIHGSAYDYFVNEAMDAGLPFTGMGTSARPSIPMFPVTVPTRSAKWSVSTKSSIPPPNGLPMVRPYGIHFRTT
jgi:hypothetical protein